MHNIQELKNKDLLSYIERVASQKAFNVGSNTYRFKVCPICGKGDHFNVNTNDNLYNGFGNSCGAGSIIDFYINFYSKDKNTSIKELCNYFNLIDTDYKAKKEVKPIPEKPAKTYKEIDITSLITEYYNSNENDLTYPIFERGIQDDSVLNKYKLLVGDPNEIFKDNIELLPGLNNIKSYENIIPVWENGKVVNCILRRNDKKSTENAKTLNLKGVEVKFFNADYLNGSEKLIFITEGVFDCLSLECMGYKSMCLNSVNMANKFIELVKENIETLKDTQFVLALDNDAPGQKAIKKISEGLKQLNIKNFSLTVNNQYKDINEYYLGDQEGLKEDIENMFSPPTVFNYMDKFLENVEINKNTKVISTGFNFLDTKLNGGLYPGLYTIGAISSLGKTALTLQIADNIAEMSNHVLFFSLEMPQDELISRSVSRHMFLMNADKCRDVSTIRVLNGLVDNCKTEFVDAVEMYKTNISKYLTIVQGNFDMDIRKITEYVKNYIESTNIKPVIIVDYLQIIELDKNSITEKKGIDNIVKGLKMLSRDFHIPVIVVSSFNRESYHNPVSFESFKESGGIEYTSDFVIGLQLTALEKDEVITLFASKDKSKLRAYLQQEKGKEAREVTLVILKNRNGKSDNRQNFKFYSKNNLFVEV